jgi:phenylacetate-CoA ligase
VLSNIKSIGSEYQVVLERRNGKDFMILKVERARDNDPSADARTAKEVTEMIKKKILVTPEVDMAEYGTLPRSERKTKRVFDNREV